MKANCSPVRLGVLAARAVRTLAFFTTLLAVTHLATAGLRDRSSLSREPGAIYLEDILDKPVKLKVKSDIAPPVFSRLDAKLRLGRMVAGSEVTVDAVTEKAYRVRGKATHGGVAGWMSPKYLEEKDPEFLAKMRKAHERCVMVQELIDANEVGLGMTIGEVEQSLGRPTASKTSVDKEGTHLTLEYTTYKRVAQREARRDFYGRIYYTTIYVKVPVGNLVVHFIDDVVTRIEEEIGTPGGGGVKIVPPPPIVVY